MKSLSINVEMYFPGDSEEKSLISQLEFQTDEKGEGGDWEVGIRNLRESALDRKVAYTAGHSTVKREKVHEFYNACSFDPLLNTHQFYRRINASPMARSWLHIGFVPRPGRYKYFLH